MSARDETEELLPCPFCGSPAEIIDIEDGENAGGSCVSCTRCEASSALDFGRKENFVSKWNTRPSPARDEGAGTMGRGEDWWLLERLFTLGQAAQAYFDGYCQDEAADDGPDFTGCSPEQHLAAKALGDALKDYSGEETLRAVHAAVGRQALSTGQRGAAPADGSQVEPSTTGAGRQIIPTDDQGGEGT